MRKFCALLLIAASAAFGAVEQNLIRLEIDTATFGVTPVNMFTGEAPLMARSRAHRFELVLLKNGVIDPDAGNVSSITLEVKTYRSQASAPLISVTTGSIDTSVTEAERVNVNGQHAVIELSEGQTGLDMTGMDLDGYKTFSLIITAVRNGRIVSLTSGAFQMLYDGGVTSGVTPIAGDPTYYTKDQVNGLISSFVQWGGNEPGRAIILRGSGGQYWRMGVNANGERVDNVFGPAGNVSFIVANVVITNMTGVTNGATFDINGDVRRLTNGTPNPLSTWVHITNSAPNQATNFLRHLNVYAPSGPVETVMTNTSTNFVMVGAPGQAVTITPSAGWASVSYTTNAYTNTMAIRMPWTMETAATRSNLMWLFVEAQNTYGSNQFDPLSMVMGKMVGTNNAQTVFAKRFNDVHGISGTNTLQRGGTYQDAVGIRLDLTNTWSLSGTNRLLVGGEYRDGVGVRLDLTNVVSLSGTNRLLREGRFENATINNITNELMVIRDNSTDAIGFEYGGAIESKIMSSGSYPFPVLRDGAGVTVNLNGVTPDDDGVLLNFASAASYFPLLNPVAGDNTNHWNIANKWGTADQFFDYGYTATNATNVQGLTFNVTNFNAAISNSLFMTGSTNQAGGAWSWPPYSYTTVASGTNTLNAVTNVEVILTGSLTADSYLAGWEGGYHGKTHEVINRTGYTLAILHDSGMEGTATDRFWVDGTLRDVNVANGGSAKFVYSSSAGGAPAGRWVVRNVWPEAAGMIVSYSVTADDQVLNLTNVWHAVVTANSGTATDRTILLTAGAYQGQEVTLEPASVSNAWELQDDSVVTGGGRVKLNSTFTSTEFDLLTLRWRGTNWLEKSRSAN